MKTILHLSVFICLVHFANAEQQIFSLTETHRGEYEDGVFKPGKPEFAFRLSFDPDKGKAILTEITRLSTKDIIAIESKFILTASDSFPILASPERKKEPFIILVGKTGNALTEAFMIGKSYFEYVKIGSGRIYLASGVTRKSISGDDDIDKLIHSKSK